MKNPDEMRSFIAGEKWIFAKTYADRAPHEYIVRGKTNCGEEAFEDAVRYIRENGMTMYFWNHPQTYIYLDGHLYWTMGEPVNEVNVINRSDVDKYKLSITYKGAR